MRKRKLYNYFKEQYLRFLCWISKIVNHSTLILWSYNINCLFTQKGIVVASKNYIWTTDVTWIILTMSYRRWPRELNALQLQKTHANRKSTSISRKHIHHFDSRWWKCSQHKQIKKHTANAHNTTKYILFGAQPILVVLWAFAACVMSNWGSCFLNLQVFFLFAERWALSATILIPFWTLNGSIVYLWGQKALWFHKLS